MSENLPDLSPDLSPDLADAVLVALEAELPILALLKQFADTACRAPWFGALGEPLDTETRALARAFLDALGFADAEAVAVLNWEDASIAAQTLDTNSPAWEAEEQLRASAAHRATELTSTEGLQIVTTDLAARLAEPLRACAEEALSLADSEDTNLRDLAVGAAQHACFGAACALADTSAEPAHNALVLKYRIFARGHWPIGVVGQSFNIF